MALTTFRYLGIQIFRDTQDLLEGNLTKAITTLKAQIKFWISPPILVAGRITLSKMVMLPRLLYYFTNLPILVPTAIFKLLDTILIELIWGSGRRRIGLRKLQLSTNNGGLGAPDFQAYCHACQLQWLTYWIVGKNLHEIDPTIMGTRQITQAVVTKGEDTTRCATFANNGIGILEESH